MGCPFSFDVFTATHMFRGVDVHPEMHQIGWDESAQRNLIKFLVCPLLRLCRTGSLASDSE
jgi:hypothetical protein